MGNKDMLMACEPSFHLQVKSWALAAMQTAPGCVHLPGTGTAGSTTSLRIIQTIQGSHKLYELYYLATPNN